MIDFDFDLGLKPKRPWWKDLVLFCTTVSGVWGVTHVALNYDAFAQITQYKFEELKASVFNEDDTPITEEKFEPIAETQKPQTISTKNLKPKNQAKELFKNMEVLPSDNRVVISKIGKNIPLITVPDHKNWQQLEQNIQKGLQNGVVVHPISHSPGNYGNFFLTGHSSYYAWDPGRFKDVFALLHEMEIGDEVVVYWEGRKYTYKINERKVVTPNEISILAQPVNRKQITLMTCTPVGTNKNRLILIGDLVKEGE